MKTICIVDDSTTILMSLKEILDKSGFKVETAGNGKEAMDKFQTGLTPNLVITDINMPLMDGIELIKQARKLPGFKFIPILALTTVSQQQKRDEAKTAGATGWIVKPVSGQDLLKVIKQVVPGA